MSDIEIHSVEKMEMKSALRDLALAIQVLSSAMSPHGREDEIKHLLDAVEYSVNKISTII